MGIFRVSSSRRKSSAARRLEVRSNRAKSGKYQQQPQRPGDNRPTRISITTIKGLLTLTSSSSRIPSTMDTTSQPWQQWDLNITTLIPQQLAIVAQTKAARAPSTLHQSLRSVIQAIIGRSSKSAPVLPPASPRISQPPRITEDQTAWPPILRP